MTIINNADFSFKPVAGRYELENKTNTTLTYNLYKIGCNNTISPVLSSGEVESLNTTTISITQDGNYYISFAGKLIVFNHWETLIREVTRQVKRVLCSCGCGGCGGCISKEAKDCIKNQNLFNLIQTLQYVVKPFSIDTAISLNTPLFTYYQMMTLQYMCTILEENCNQLLRTSISGLPHTNTKLFNTYIAIYYLGLYHYYSSNVDDEQVEYINTLFNFNKIKKCIIGLGINPDTLEEVFEEELPNQPPNQLTIVERVIYIGDFWNGTIIPIFDLLVDYQDPEDDAPLTIKFNNITPEEASIGVYEILLDYGGNFTPVEFGVEYELTFTAIRINLLNLTGITNDTIHVINYGINDVGSEEFNNEGEIRIGFAGVVINQPPSQLTQVHTTMYLDVLDPNVSPTLEDVFIDYIDPENDAPLTIKFTDIPAGETIPYLFIIYMNFGFGLELINLNEAYPLPFQELKIIPVDETLLTDGNEYTISYSVSDVGSQQYNDLGKIYITIQKGSEENLPPNQLTQINKTIIGETESADFSLVELLSDYEDPENDEALSIKFTTIPEGFIVYLNIDGETEDLSVTLNEVYPLNFEYIKIFQIGEEEPLPVGEYIFNYSINDVGSEIYNDDGIITITKEAVNQPPSQLTLLEGTITYILGGGERGDVSYGFSVFDLMDNYIDPENDSPEHFKLSPKDNFNYFADSNGQYIQIFPDTAYAFSLLSVLYIHPTAEILDGVYEISYAMSDVGSHQFNEDGIIVMTINTVEE